MPPDLATDFNAPYRPWMPVNRMSATDDTRHAAKSPEILRTRAGDTDLTGLRSRRAPSQPGSALAVPGTEFEYSDADFERIRKLIYREAGIKLCPSKRTMAYGRLVRRLRALGLNRFSDYLDLAENDKSGELQAFTNALTTNLTSFFREAHHFPVLQEYLAPRLLRGEATIWCAGCSTGEEPYSIMMSLAVAFGASASRIHLLATDVDTSVLEIAERGVYPLDRVDKLPPGYKERFFLEGTASNAGFVRVRPELRKGIVFRQLNLLESTWTIRGPVDAIFCRNVMIYFDKATQYLILERFASLLEPGGLLFAGHSENFTQAGILFFSRGRTVYERIRQGARPVFARD
jgi:chemotaxis protein methyltransferase CheR